jgi:hypothetical protein
MWLQKREKYYGCNINIATFFEKMKGIYSAIFILFVDYEKV